MEHGARLYMLRTGLRWSETGRDVLALIEGSPAEAGMIADRLSRDKRLEKLMRSRMKLGLLRQGDIARRVATLFEADEGDAAWLLLDAALQAASDGHVLVRVKAKQLLSEKRDGEIDALARQYLGKKSASAAGLRALAYGLDRAAESGDQGLLDEAVRRYFDMATKSPGDRSRAEAKLYETLGMGAFAKLRKEKQSAAMLNRSELYHGPLDQAFDALLNGGLQDVASYEPANRLLLVGNTLAGGGMERVLASTYRHFSQSPDFADVDLGLLDYQPDAPSSFYAREAGINASDVFVLRRKGSVNPPMDALPKSWQARCQHLFEHIEKTRPRIVHAWNDLTGLLAAYAGLLAGCPRIIVHFHHGSAVPLASRAEPVASYPAVYRKLLYRPECEMIFCADAAARDYADWWSLPMSERFTTIYNGFSRGKPVEKPTARARLSLPQSAPIIGTVMRFAPVKQPLKWAEAAIELSLSMPDAHFLMVGESGTIGTSVKAKFEKAGLGERLHMPGQVSNVDDYYATMDMLWLTSRSEGLPNVCIEAQFSGVPVGAFDVGGVGETIADGETGFLVPSDDFEALAEQSRLLLADPERMQAMGKRARKRATELFSSDIFFQKLSALYEN